MPFCFRFIPLVLGLCGVLLTRPAAADLPSPYGYDVRVNGKTVTSAITYHADSVIRGTDPESGVTYLLGSLEWSGLEIDGAMYTFRVTPPGGSFYPFNPTWVVRLKDVSFSNPPLARPAAVCRKRPAHVVLMGDQRIDDCDGCGVAGTRRFKECPALFPKTEPTRHYVTLDDIKGLPFVQIDVSEAHKVVKRCQQGNKEACDQVYQRYTSTHPGGGDSLCELQAAGQAWGAPYSADEQECLFHAYYATLQEDCRPSRCEVKYRWGGKPGQPVQNPVWKPVPLPPPLDQHERLFPKKPVHVPFKQIVQRCLQQDQTACLRVSGGYYGLPRSENSKTNCYMEVNGKRSFHWATEDAEECAFHTYYKALDSGCRLPGCNVKYLWQGKRTLSDSETQEKWPTEGWQVLTAPPPIDKHERLMSANNW
ncbi:hypothetical protein [Archangium violaceum]|uniref:hypothetical protein n=1 Tax=Archangium violaceum TaxID=83451 RepID=UPI0036DDDC7A